MQNSNARFEEPVPWPDFEGRIIVIASSKSGDKFQATLVGPGVWLSSKKEIVRRVYTPQNPHSSV